MTTIDKPMHTPLESAVRTKVHKGPWFKTLVLEHENVCWIGDTDDPKEVCVSLERADFLLRVINRDHAFDEVVKALERSAEGWSNAIEMGIISSQHVTSATILRDEALAALKLANPQG